MSYIASNIVAIIAATIAGLLVGAVFRPLTERLQLSLEHGWTRHSFGLLIAAVCAEFWLASILAGALILAPATEASVWTMAIGSAVVIWIGFVVPVLIVSYSSPARSHNPVGLRALALRDGIPSCGSAYDRFCPSMRLVRMSR